MRPRSLVFGFLAAFLAAAAAVSGYWVWWAGTLERGLADWRDKKRLRGYEITYGGPAIDGFPLAHVTRIDAPALRSPNGARWRGPAMTARAPSWDPGAILVTFPGRHEVERLNAGALSGLVLDSRAAEASLRLGWGGRLETAEATVLGLEALAEPFGRFLGERLRLTVTPDYGPDGESVLGHGFTLETETLEVPAAVAGPLDPRAEKIVLAGRLNGVVPGTQPRRALSLWRERGGALELDLVEIDWSPLVVSASGRLTLDGRLRPQGQLAARITGLPELLDRLVALGLMPADQVARMKPVILAFSGERDEEGRPVLAAPLILNAGVLSLGPLPLARISPVL